MNARGTNLANEAIPRHLHGTDLHGIGLLVLLVLDMVIDRVSTVEREAVLAALNGLFGDLLAREQNPLAIRMALRQQGNALRLERDALAEAIEAPSGKLLILVHGLCCSDLRWRRRNHDHGAALARDLGYTPLYLHYNSGRHVSTNGHEFAALLEPALTAPLACLGRLRSEGITDLRYGNLLDEDWRDRDRFAHEGDVRRHVPLPRGVKCYAIAGSIGRQESDLRERLLGDGLLPVDTALGHHVDPGRSLSFPPSRQWVAFGAHHLDLLNRSEVYEKIHTWLAQKNAGPNVRHR